MNKKHHFQNMTAGDKAFIIFVYLFVTLALLICFYPMYYIVIRSFSREVVGVYLWPKGVTIGGYLEVLKYKDVWRGYGNTILYTIIGTLISLFCTLTFAYAFSRQYLVGKKIFTLLIMIPMFIGGGMIPSYLTVQSLGLDNTRTYIFICSAATTYNIMVARTFFKTSIPDELYEASILDGCNESKFFTAVVLPLSKAIIAVEALYYGVARWNSYSTEMIYLRDRKKYSLALFLRELLWTIDSIQRRLTGDAQELNKLSPSEILELQKRADLANSMQFVLIIVSCIPMMIIYPYLQKYFAKGVMVGSVKG